MESLFVIRRFRVLRWLDSKYGVVCGFLSCFLKHHNQRALSILGDPGSILIEPQTGLSGSTGKIKDTFHSIRHRENSFLQQDINWDYFTSHGTHETRLSRSGRRFVRARHRGAGTRGQRVQVGRRSNCMARWTAPMVFGGAVRR